MDSHTLATIHSLARTSPPTKVANIQRDRPAAGLLQDLVKGAAANPRLQGIEIDGALAAAGFSPQDVAKTAGALVACHELGLSVKEAASTLNLHEDFLQAIAVIAQ
jgi:hypothetical protein